MIVTEDSMRILQVNLGAITAQIWEQRPELRERIGREWTKPHYQRHRQDRTRKSLKDAVKVLERLMSAGGYTHLILAGQPSTTSQVQQNLPRHLQDQLIDIVPASGTMRMSDVVEATLSSFVEAEEQESRAVVADLVHQLRTGGLAVVGTDPSLRALYCGRVDVLVLSKEYVPGPGWLCENCGYMDLESAGPVACPTCEGQVFRRFNTKEAMVCKAVECDCTIEVVTQSDELMHLGGVGCLLSYRLPDEYVQLRSGLGRHTRLGRVGTVRRGQYGQATAPEVSGHCVDRPWQSMQARQRSCWRQPVFSAVRFQAVTQGLTAKLSGATGTAILRLLTEGLSLKQLLTEGLLQMVKLLAAGGLS